MERKIKFRGKSKIGEEWFYGYFSKIHFGRDFEDSIIVFDGCNTMPKQIISETLGMFTGFIDNNGVEIYEYDIVQITDDIKLYEILFIKGCFCLFINDTIYKYLGEFYGNYICVGFREKKITVVGNRHTDLIIIQNFNTK
jgi:hypothetical protein